MAYNHTDINKDPHPPKFECDEIEHDGDSVWSSASESVSEAASDNISSVDSALRDLPTVRTNRDEGENEIQRLILAAEALGLERARLKLSGHVSATDTLRCCGAVATSVLGSGKHLMGQQNNCIDSKGGTANSGYLTDSENTGLTSHMTSSLSMEKSVNIEVFGEKDQYSVQSRGSLSSTVCDSLLSKTSDSSLKGHDHIVSGDLTPGKHHSNIPRLPLEPDGSANSEWPVGALEERVAINKVVKEACNSSIKCSSGGIGDPLKGSQTNNSGGGQQPPVLPHARVPGQAASVVVHEEGSCLLNLALTSTSSLKRLTRLLRQVAALQLGPDTPRLGQSVQHELEQHEAQQQNLEAQLATAAAQLQVAVAQVQELEGQKREQQQQAEATHQSASTLLQQVEASLESCGLQHMMAVTSPRRRGMTRVLEDVGSAVALLTNEVARRTQRLSSMEEEAGRLREELKGVRESLVQRDARVVACEIEARQQREQSEADITALRQCLVQAEASSTTTQLENARLVEEVRRQATEGDATLTALQKRLCEAQHKADERVSALEQDLHCKGKEKQRLEESVRELKDQLTLRTQQMHMVEEENNLLIENLRSALKQQQTEIQQLQHNLDTATTEKNCITRTADEMKCEMATKEVRIQEVEDEARELRRRVTEILEEHSEAQKTLQDKVNSLSSECSELEGHVRAHELTILQLRTELEMEKLQTHALTHETAALEKKAKDLQGCLWTYTQKQRNNSGSSSELQQQHETGGSSVCGSCASLHAPPGTPHGSPVHHALSDDRGSLAREERLQALLREKDTELHNLHHSLSSEITVKNQELEDLTKKLIVLEGQLGTLVQGLEASAAIGGITTEVGQLLQERTTHLDTLKESSQWLQHELSSLSLENQTLSKELAVSRRTERNSVEEAQESLRRARQEARKEKLNAARLQEDCSRLQAELNLALHTIRHERQEKRMIALVNEAKHQEFGSLIESATAALNHYKM